MYRRTFSLAALAFAATAFSAAPALAADELRVMVHNSFSLPKPLLAQFEAQAGIKLSIIKAGDAGEMLNKLILTRAQPLADVVFGIDNAQLVKAQAAQVLEAHGQAGVTGSLQLGPQVVAVDYSFVALNYDKAAVAKSGLPLPKTLEDLTQAPYRNWLVVENPATSSPGYAFLLATVAGMGEEKAFDWWARMRANGLKVSKGWSEAYYTEFSRNGGSRPLVVGYATSPAAEVFYSKEKITESPTASLFLKGGVFRQVEGAALIKGGGHPEAARQFIEFMRSAPVQQALQTSMWMFPLDPRTPRVEVMRHAPEPAAFESLSSEVIADKGSQWVSRWTQVVLK
ncbi:thiamine transport system substrate-binding protein [Polaromonas sp. OV174]|uniref:thiamine ABC transporter substrate-binding protein n=1 Tax=Polaromonas sp. OV174 TaxID=1855300 RepID=UPI0008EDAA60|nr:thiamine ABC transporter substrate-binding protein [Polaromonas sp. OV174]SFC70992.1 thiamine transport system substrate-binding protein [Polaromonas sp. OV174]